MKQILLGTISFVFIIGATLSGQTRPDLTGTWVMDPARSETLAQGVDASPTQPVTLKITQTTEGLTVEKRVDGVSKVVNYLYRTQNPEPVKTSETTQNPQPGETSETNRITVDKATANWRGGKVELQSDIQISDKPVTRTETYSVDSTGQVLTVETLLFVHHGYQGPGKNYNTVTDVYRKRAD